MFPDADCRSRFIEIAFVGVLLDALVAMGLVYFFLTKSEGKCSLMREAHSSRAP